MKLPVDTTSLTNVSAERQTEYDDLEILGQLLARDRDDGPLGNDDCRLLTVSEVASTLAIGRSKVYELLYRGELKSVKIGGARRIRYRDLGEFVRFLDDAS